VAIACERAKAEMVLSSGMLPSAVGESPTVVVAGLEDGDRRIPEELLTLLRREHTADALLLICNEPLIRPSVSLCRGRVALVGSDATADTIASQLRILLAGHATLFGSGYAGERAHPYWWSRDTNPADATSVQCIEEHGGFTHVFALDGAIDLPPASILALRKSLRDHSDHPTNSLRPLGNRLGSTLGATHYNPQRETILLMWPPTPHTLWMVSPVRLPVLCDLSCLGKGITYMQAAGGDVLLALSHGDGTATTRAITHILPTRALFGGPSVFDAIIGMRNSGAISWATVTELR
jgi:hypothetical protein